MLYIFIIIWISKCLPSSIYATNIGYVIIQQPNKKSVPIVEFYRFFFYITPNPANVVGPLQIETIQAPTAGRNFLQGYNSAL
ncbi:hypothetical protein D3C85_1430580 [compost metagenome]